MTRATPEDILALRAEAGSRRARGAGSALSPSQEAELGELAFRFGEPLRVDVALSDGFLDPIYMPDRCGEVCMVIRRPNGKVLLSTKTFYPPGAYRLPTGGIEPSEGIFAALLREAHEETGLLLAVRRFLTDISYRTKAGRSGDREPAHAGRPYRAKAGQSGDREPGQAFRPRAAGERAGGHGPVIFRTLAFLMDELGGRLAALDEHERIKDYREVAVTELPIVADRLDALGSETSSEIVGDWADWGRFRAVVHRAVHEALAAR